MWPSPVLKRTAPSLVEALKGTLHAAASKYYNFVNFVPLILFMFVSKFVNYNYLREIEPLLKNRAEH